MTSRRRILTIALVIALLLTISCTALAQGRSRAEPKTVHYRTGLKVVVDGRVTTPEARPFIIEPGWVMVPAEFIAKELGASVSWDDANSTLAITSKGSGASVVQAQDQGGSQPTQDASPSTQGTPPPTGGTSPSTQGASPSTGTKDLKGVIAEVSPSVVLISTYDSSGFALSQGSGVVVGKNKIITNLHVIHNAAKVEVIDPSGATYTCSGTLAQDPGRDLALLKCEIPLAPVELGDSDAVAVGDPVVAIGSPRGLQGTVSNGIISGLREFGGVSYVQTSAPTSKGSSGGGLFAMDASLVGITTLIYEDSQNLNLAVPVNYVKDLMSTPVDVATFTQTRQPGATPACLSVAD